MKSPRLFILLLLTPFLIIPRPARAEIAVPPDDVLVAMVAEVLGLDPFDIRCVTGDTDLTPVDLGSYSSRVTLMMGNAAIQAAERARGLIASAVATKLDVPANRLVFAGKRVFDREDPDRGLDWVAALVCAEETHGTLGSVGSYTPPRSVARFKGGGVGPSAAYSYTAAVVEVEVDKTTGWITVPRVYIAHDIGQAINPVLVRGQVEGGVYMGLGEALMEEQVFRRLPEKRSSALVHKFPSMLEYKSPTSHDMPEIITDLIEAPDPNGPFGAKEVGQGPLLSIMPAVANAVYDAIGVRIDEVPITPDKIMRALDDKAKGGPGRVGPDAFLFTRRCLSQHFIINPQQAANGYLCQLIFRHRCNHQQQPLEHTVIIQTPGSLHKIDLRCTAGLGRMMADEPIGQRMNRVFTLRIAEVFADTGQVVVIIAFLFTIASDQIGTEILPNEER